MIILFHMGLVTSR